MSSWFKSYYGHFSTSLLPVKRKYLGYHEGISCLLLKNPMFSVLIYNSSVIRQNRWNLLLSLSLFIYFAGNLTLHSIQNLKIHKMRSTALLLASQVKTAPPVPRFFKDPQMSLAHVYILLLFLNFWTNKQCANQSEHCS